MIFGIVTSFVSRCRPANREYYAAYNPREALWQALAIIHAALAASCGRVLPHPSPGWGESAASALSPGRQAWAGFINNLSAVRCDTSAHTFLNSLASVISRPIARNSIFFKHGSIRPFSIAESVFCSIPILWQSSIWVIFFCIRICRTCSPNRLHISFDIHKESALL